MGMPQRPPQFQDILKELDSESLIKILSIVQGELVSGSYLHWDKLRRYTPPEGITLEQWWLGLKLKRQGMLTNIPFKSTDGESFKFGMPTLVMEEIHRIDTGAGRSLGVPEPITNPQTRDRYLMTSLMEEAITSSQLEGASTTREVAKEMIRTGRYPMDISERMILNNYVTMRRIRELRTERLSPKLVFEIHKLVTSQTLKEKDGEGRLRRADEIRIVGNEFGEVYHTPPPAAELPERLEAMCRFANQETPDFFVHPVIRSIILHFWLAYDHPFVDGNGRTARALFYWSMLRSGYWLFEFISISTILRKAPSKYGKSFLYTETDNNDLTYFIVAQCNVIRRAINELHEYIERKSAETKELEQHLRALQLFNHRQSELLRHALKHPFQIYTVQSHQQSHGVVYQTARNDLLTLTEKGLLIKKMRGKEMIFTPVENLAEKLREIEKG